MKYFFHYNELQLSIGETEELYPANYRGCRHAKEEMQKRKS
jgi:hypothetical protein